MEDINNFRCINVFWLLDHVIWNIVLDKCWPHSPVALVSSLLTTTLAFWDQQWGVCPTGDAVLWQSIRAIILIKVYCGLPSSFRTNLQYTPLSAWIQKYCSHPPWHHQHPLASILSPLALQLFSWFTLSFWFPTTLYINLCRYSTQWLLKT